MARLSERKSRMIIRALPSVKTIERSSTALKLVDFSEELLRMCGMFRKFAATIKYDDVMTAITINIPNHEVSFFKKMIAKMGWTYSEADVVRSAATPKEQALAKVDHAFGQLRQMKDGELEGINAEDLLNEL